MWISEQIVVANIQLRFKRKENGVGQVMNRIETITSAVFRVTEWVPRERKCT